MRILLLTPDPAESGGGVSSYVRYHAEGLRSEGYDVQVLSVNSRGRSGRSAILQFAYEAASCIREFDPDVLHAHGVWQAATPFFLRCSVRAVFTFHTEPDLRRFQNRVVARLLIRRAAVSTTLSGYARSRIESAIEGGSVQVVPPALPLMAAKIGKAEARGRLAVPASAFVLAVVTPLVYPEKVRGLPILFDSLPSDSAKTHIVLAGGGPLMRQVESWVRDRGLTERVHLLGELADPSVLYDAADAYVQASLKDNLPISLLEAMSRDLPVVAFRIGGIPEAIRHGETGLLCDPDLSSLQQQLDRLQSDEALARRLGAHAGLEVRDRYSWSKIGPLWSRIYRG